MSNIQRLRVNWTGFPGGPGISTFYGSDAVALAGALLTLFDAIKAFLPNDVTISPETTGDTLDDATGVLTSGWTGGPTWTVTGTGNTAYAAPAGVMIKWLTNAVFQGHRVRGRTFLVPTATGVFAIDGTMAPASVAAGNAALATFVSSASAYMMIWSRPRAASPAWTDVRGKVHPAKPALAGFAHALTGGVFVDKAVVLRSRRD